MKWLSLILSLGIAIGLFYFLNFPHGILPPLGKFLNPYVGFWQNGTTSDNLPSILDVEGLKDSVTVLWDDRGVPHIFARNEYDLYFAQGYITARDRLWQMEFQAFTIAGRVSEIVGKQALEYDRFRRRTGMLYAAENALNAVLAHPETWAASEAYAAGVNAYIKSLNSKNLPLEYKILDYMPEKWTMLNSTLLLKFMSWNLTAYSIQELFMTRAITALGEAETAKLYPYYPPYTDPIIPPGTPWNFRPQISEKPASDFTPTGLTLANPIELTSSFGSNNWAVSIEKTASGYPILCNDPHLSLNLPSIWYEIQLISPQVNVYGVSLPGAPAVIIGFNNEIAWGATNAETDVLDWYEIEFKDDTKSAYLYDDEWLPTTVRIEEIKVRGGETIIDTVYYTHHGPVVYEKAETPFDEQIPPGSAMRWTGHDPSNDVLTFLKLNRAHNYDDYVEALFHYDCPGQNFVFASAKGDIAIWHNGKFPLRWERQGRYIANGRNSAYDWQGWIPRSHLPHIKNPQRGFVSSANQYPADKTYPYYLIGNYFSFERGVRINQRLAEMENITPQDMITLQNDVINLHARKILPVLLSLLDSQSLTEDEIQSYEKLKSWNYEHRADLIAPTIFEYWWDELSNLIWLDDIETSWGELLIPRWDATIALILKEPESPYFDIRTTTDKETLTDLVIKSFHSAIRKLTAELGSLGSNWQWGKVRTTDINHLVLIPGLGCTGLPTNGSASTVNVKKPTFGPSWRMVVSLGEEVEGWGIYPGGQSGNPGSQFYDNFVANWVSGNMYELLYLKSSNDKHGRLVGKTVMRSAQ